MRLCPQERRASHRNRSEERSRRQHRRLPRIHEEIREEYSQLVHRRSGGTSSGGFLQAEHPFIVQDIIEVVTYINYSKKEEADPNGRFLVFYMVMMSSRKALTERGRPRPRERLPKERSSEERQRYEIVSKEQGILPPFFQRNLPTNFHFSKNTTRVLTVSVPEMDNI